MTVFLDTSALYALLDADDAVHARAVSGWDSMITSGVRMVTSNYILVESAALLQSRFGAEAVRVFTEDIAPLLHVEWIDEGIHRAAVGAFLAASGRRLSLVDCASFEVMRRLGIRKAFTFDAHFRRQGFSCVP